MPKLIAELVEGTTLADADLIPFVVDPASPSTTTKRITVANARPALLPVASTAQVKAGTANNAAVTPLRLREQATAVDVRWFGAVADGTTDCLSAFNSALAYAISSGLRAVLVPGGGTYKISNTWVIRASNVEIIVEPGATISLTTTSTYGGAIAIAEGTAYGGSDASMLDNVVLRGGGTIYSTGDLENAVGIVRARNVTVEGMTISAGRFGISAQVKVENSHIVRNTVLLAHAAAIDISDVGAVTMLNNRIEGNVVVSSTVSGSLAGEGIRATCFDGLLVKDNVVIYSQGRGIRLYGTAGLPSKRLVVDGNRVYSTGSLVIDLQYINSVVGACAVQGDGGAANLAKLDTTDLGASITGSPTLSSFTLDTLTGPSKLRLVVNGQVAATGALSVIAPPSGHDWEVQIGAGSHNRICANSVALNLRGSAAGGSVEPFASTCTLLPTSNLAVNGGRKYTSTAYSATVVPDFWTQSTVAITLTGNITISNMGATVVTRVPGHRITFVFTQDATGSRTVTWGADYKVGTWQMSTAPSSVSSITFESNGTNWIAVADVLPNALSTRAITTTTYTAVAADAGRLITLSNAAAITVTLPTPTSLGLTAGTIITFTGIAAGLFTFAAGAGATVNSPRTLGSRAQWSSVRAVAVSTTGWVLDGDLA